MNQPTSAGILAEYREAIRQHGLLRVKYDQAQAAAKETSAEYTALGERIKLLKENLHGALVNETK